MRSAKSSAVILRRRRASRIRSPSAMSCLSREGKVGSVAFAMDTHIRVYLLASYSTRALKTMGKVLEVALSSAVLIGCIKLRGLGGLCGHYRP